MCEGVCIVCEICGEGVSVCVCGGCVKSEMFDVHRSFAKPTCSLADILLNSTPPHHK